MHMPLAKSCVTEGGRPVRLCAGGCAPGGKLTSRAGAPWIAQVICAGNAPAAREDP